MDDLDRLIDEAARQMAQHEPSDALSGAVMERVASAWEGCSRSAGWAGGVSRPRLRSPVW